VQQIHVVRGHVNEPVKGVPLEGLEAASIVWRDLQQPGRRPLASARGAAEEARETTQAELEQLKNEALDLHNSCDFTMKNFDIRQASRDQEVEALRQAKSILSGAKFTEFLQRRA